MGAAGDAQRPCTSGNTEITLPHGKDLLDVIDANFEQFSSLRGNYDARIEWRARVAAMRSTTFANDYAQYQAVSNLLEDFRDAHWYYGGPPCYEQMFFASIPLDFGSAYTRTRPGHAREQIIYLEAPYVGLTDWYLAITGIDLTQYEGMRVVSIDGQGVLDYFRDFGADVLRDDDDPGVNLMGVLEFGYWSLRMGKTYPTAPSVTLVLETRRGHRQSVVLPWVFAPAGLFGVPVPVPASCTVIWRGVGSVEPSGPPSAVGTAPSGWAGSSAPSPVA